MTLGTLTPVNLDQTFAQGIYFHLRSHGSPVSIIPREYVRGMKMTCDLARKAPSNLRGSALASGKPVQHKHALPSPVPRSIKKTSQRMTPGGARIDLRTEIVPLGRNSIDLSGASAVAGRSPSTRTQFVPLRRKTTTHNGASSVDGQFPPTRTLASSSRRDNTGGSSPPRSTLRQVRRKTVSDSGSAHVRKGTTANLSSPPPRPLGDKNDANVVYFEPDDRVTPRNLKFVYWT